MIRGDQAWETHYDFKDVEALVTAFEEAGFYTEEVLYSSCTVAYLERFFTLKEMARLYDKIVEKLKVRRAMGNVCITFAKRVDGD